MRIVGGTLRGRKIEPPLSTVTRPMMDRVRQALFNVLEHRDWGKGIGDLFDEDTHVLDAFCGTGALAFEAVSRGAGHAALFDRDAQALKIARGNAAHLGIEDKCAIFAVDATNPPPAPHPAKLVFLAPPYRKNLIPASFAALDTAGWIAPHAVIVAETAKNETLETPEGCELVLARGYGEPMLHFFRRWNDNVTSIRP
ncbi:MAG: RsmD family RNA methyltransferase [Alphaproteobacteria bacterium]|nr:RsmD family RNA methyltransferase [Alphaproteobacteria bacterium]